MIIRDIHKAEYNRYLNKAQHEQDYKGLEAYFEKEQKYLSGKHNPNDI